LEHLSSPTLDAVSNTDWKDRDAIKFTASDGYQLIIPISVILKEVGNRGELIADIVEYLKVMANRKPLNR